MARLPQPGGDAGNWGTILNEYLSQAHAPDGKLKADTVTAASISNGAITTSHLSGTIQSSLDKADSAYQKPSDGIPLADIEKADLDGAYAPLMPDTGITYDGNGNVQTVTENSVTTTYTYNPDGTVATDTRAGVTRTYTYDGSGNLTGIAS